MGDINQRASSMIDFMNEIEKASKARQANENLKNSDHAKRKILDNKKSEAKGICVDIIFNKIYKDALPMNDEYKIAHGTELDNEFRDFVSIKAPDGLECYLHESMNRGNKVAKMLVESVNKLVNDYYFEASMNISKTDVDKLSFDPNEEENHRKIAEITDKMDTEEISEIIKNNVKQAAISDIQKTKAHDEEMKNLVEELKNDPKITSEAAIDRHLNLKGVNDVKFYQPSLFEGIMINKLNLIKESGEEVSPEDANKKAFFESMKEFTKLSVLDALYLENVAQNQKKIANDYAKMKVASSKITFYEEVEDMLKAQRDSMFKDSYVEEGANLEIRTVFKDAQKKYKELLKESKKLHKEDKWDEAIGKLNEAKNLMDKCYEEIQKIDASEAGSVTFSWLLTGWIPFFGRGIISMLLPFVALPIGVNTTVKRLKVMFNDTKKKGSFDMDDLNYYKNGLKVRINEIKKSLDLLISVYQKGKAKSGK